MDCFTPCIHRSTDLETFDIDPGVALAYAYDFVCNGNDLRWSIVSTGGTFKNGVRRHGAAEGAGAEKFGFSSTPSTTVRRHTADRPG